MNTSIRIKRLIFCCIFSTLINAPIALAETIGVSIPLSGDMARLGQEFRLGAKLAMETFGKEHQLVIADDGCEYQIAQQAAKELEAQNAAIITGLLCNEVALHMAERFRESKTPLLIAGARSVQLTKDRNNYNWSLWQLSPTDAYAAKASAETMAKLWLGKPFALIGDGLLYARTNLDNVNTYLSEHSLSPQTSKTMKPNRSEMRQLISWLERNLISGVFVASRNTSDLISFVEIAQSSHSNITLLLSEQLANLPLLKRADLLKPGFMVMKPVIPNSPFKAQLNNMLKENDITPSENIYYGFAAIQIAIKALEDTNNETASSLNDQQFNTILGNIKFDENGANLNNPYRAHQWDGKTFIPIELN